MIFVLASKISASVSRPSLPYQSRIRMMQSASSTAIPSGFLLRAVQKVSGSLALQTLLPQVRFSMGLSSTHRPPELQGKYSIGRLARYSSSASDSSE